MSKMTWEKIPKGTPMSISKENVEKIHGNTTAAFVKGVVTGAIGLLIIQGCEATTELPDGNVKQTPTISATQSPTISSTSR